MIDVVETRTNSTTERRTNSACAGTKISGMLCPTTKLCAQSHNNFSFSLKLKYVIHTKHIETRAEPTGKNQTNIDTKTKRIF